MSSSRHIVRTVAGSLLAVLLATIAPRGIGDVTGLSDPTRPLRPDAVASVSATAAARAQPVLQSVLIGPGRRLAVIDGQRMSEGEERYGMKVLEIRPDGVVVSMNGAARMTLPVSDARMHKEMR